MDSKAASEGLSKVVGHPKVVMCGAAQGRLSPVGGGPEVWELDFGG